MSERKRRDLPGGAVPTLATSLAIALAAGACSAVPNPAYTGPGWYLEKPVQLLAAGPRIYGGPFNYEQCETERTKLPKQTADQMLCFRHLAAPGMAGPYLTDMDARRSAQPTTLGTDPDTVAGTQEQRVSSGPRP